MFNLIREISETVQLANRIANESGGNGPRWSVFVTNRSFVAQVFTVVFMVLALCGIPLPIPAEMAADTVWIIASGLMMAWAGLERLFGKTRVIWSKQQAYRAVSEADALSKALKDAGAL